jgi:hypothetical protein
MNRFAYLLGLSLATGSFAATVAGVSIADSVRVGTQTLVLQGTAIRSKLIFKVYVAALYLPARRADAPAVLAADEPRRMEMRFLRAVSSGKVCEAWKEGLAANVPGAGDELKGQFDRLCAWVPDVLEGSLVALTYVPGSGTSVEVDGQARGMAPGKAFADAVLACWIGPEPGPGPDFKRSLLGG